MGYDSYHMNIIAYVCGVLDTKMHSRKRTTAYSWRQRMKAAWDEVEQSTTNTLVGSVKSWTGDMAESKRALGWGC
jgi:hypothetical protein